MNNFCTIYLVRHGRTDWNDKKLIQGHTDIKLNSEGQISAKELAKKFKNIKFDKIYSSDLLRAKETAEIIALEHKIAVETTELLRERNFGYLEGNSGVRLKEIGDLISQLEESEKFSYKHHPSMESDEELMSRFSTFLREIAISNPSKTILITAHGGPMRILLIQLGILTYQKYVEVNNLAYIKLESDGVDFFVKQTSGIGDNLTQTK